MKTAQYVTQIGIISASIISDDPDNTIIEVKFPNGTKSQFTANVDTKIWGHAGDDTWTTTESVSRATGIHPELLFPAIGPALSAHAGWVSIA